MIEVLLNDRLGKKVRVKCKCWRTQKEEDLRRLAVTAARVAKKPPPLPLSSPPTVSLSCLPSGNEDDTIGDLKKLVAAQIGTRPEKIKLQKWYTVYKDHITLEDYEIHDGMNLEMYYN